MDDSGRFHDPSATPGVKVSAWISMMPMRPLPTRSGLSSAETQEAEINIGRASWNDDVNHRAGLKFDAVVFDLWGLQVQANYVDLFVI